MSGQVYRAMGERGLGVTVNEKSTTYVKLDHKTRGTDGRTQYSLTHIRAQLVTGNYSEVRHPWPWLHNTHGTPLPLSGRTPECFTSWDVVREYLHAHGYHTDEPIDWRARASSALADAEHWRVELEAAERELVNVDARVRGPMMARLVAAEDEELRVSTEHEQVKRDGQRRLAELQAQLRKESEESSARLMEARRKTVAARAEIINADHHPDVIDQRNYVREVADNVKAANHAYVEANRQIGASKR